MTEFSHGAYMATEARISPWSIVPGWSLHQNLEDLMHDFHEGIGRDLCASVIQELVQEQSRATGASVQSNLRMLTLEMKAWCKAAGIKPVYCTFSVNGLGGMTSTYAFPFMSSR